MPVRLLAAWPTVALVGSYELLMMIIHGAQVPVTVVAGLYGSLPGADPVRVQAALVFADDLAAGRVPSVPLSARGFMSGPSRAQRAQAYLASLTAG